MTTVPLEICLRGFKRSFGFQCISLYEVERAKSRQAGLGLAVLGASLWSRWPGRGCPGWSMSMVKLVSSDSASSQHSKRSVKTETEGG